MVRLVMPDGSRRELEVPAGVSILETARLHDVAIEGACGGAMACATCHVHVAEGWFERLPPATPEEEDMLDLALELRPNSRLGCQIRVTAELDGLELAVPQTTLLDG